MSGIHKVEEKIERISYFMYIVYQKFTVEDGQADQLVKTLANRKVLTEQDGFIDAEILKNEEDKNVVGIIAKWESKDAWKAWENTNAREEAGEEDPVNIKETVTDRYEVVGKLNK